MIRKLFVLLAILPIILSAQWRPLDVPAEGRYDDIFFVDETTGWAVNSNREIYKTIDGGVTWQLNFIADNYLRSIEFATPLVGYAGSLYNSIYRTQNGGETWENISDNVDFDITYNGENFTSIPGACGLSAPSENTIYACGLWSGDPPFLSKSIDGGETWTTYDMGAHATQLVDVFFLNDDEGYLAGRNDPTGNEKGGIILRTTDGGVSWTNVLETGMYRDYIWKIQTPDSINFFGSVQSDPYTGNVRFAKSTDGGETWEIKIVQTNKWNYMQMIGFKNANTGWTGGTASPQNGNETALFETNDGGESWEQIVDQGNSTFNRFFMLNKDQIFLTGRKLYVYDKDYIGEEGVLNVKESLHEMVVYPNPASVMTSVDVNISQFTRCKLELINSSGQLVRRIHHGTIQAGKHSFIVPLEDIDAGTYFVILHTNEGLNYSRILKE